MRVETIFESDIFRVDSYKEKNRRATFRVLLISYRMSRYCPHVTIEQFREMCNRAGLTGIAHGFSAHRFTSRTKALKAVTAIQLML